MRPLEGISLSDHPETGRHARPYAKTTVKLFPAFTRAAFLAGVEVGAIEGQGQR